MSAIDTFQIRSEDIKISEDFMLPKCKKCNKVIPPLDKIKFCPYCGTKLEEDKKDELKE